MSTPAETTPSDGANAELTGVSGTGYQVIARRYRPRFFHEVVGQEAIAETLKQAIAKNRLAHAYLFCGPRGVGKTSMARILARVLQCANAKDGNPCDQCDTCERIFRGEDLDVVEMDGASNRGIDDVRGLIEHVRFAPSSGKYRIFIIDEVHMLTREAFNALLKTLEEPPAHVKFIFATTEPEKVLATVISRCQRYDFSAISIADLVRRLQQICESEGATPEEGLLEQIADLAHGGMRDSQSLLDQLLSFGGLSPTRADLDRITGRLSPEKIRQIVDAVEAGEKRAVVTELQAIEATGTDPAVVLEQVIEEFRGRLHRGVADGWGDGDIERNLLAQEVLQEARFRMRQLGRAEVVLELALLRVSTLSHVLPLERLLGKLGSETDDPSTEGGGPGKPDRVVPPPRSSGPEERGASERRVPLAEDETKPSPERVAPRGRRESFDDPASDPHLRDRSAAPAPAEPPATADRSQASSPEGLTDSNSAGSVSTHRAGGPGPAARRRSDEESPFDASIPYSDEPDFDAISRELNAPAREPVAPRADRSAPTAAPTREAPSRAPARAAEPAPVATTDDAVRIVESVRDCITRVSPTLARLVGGRVAFDEEGERLTITVAEEGRMFADGRRLDELQREVNTAVGRRIPVHVAVAQGSAAAAELAEAHETDSEVPDIVNKAIEIFRGSMR